MEVVIVGCLLIIIGLLISEKISLKIFIRRKNRRNDFMRKKPVASEENVIGAVRTLARQSAIVPVNPVENLAFEVPTTSEMEVQDEIVAEIREEQACYDVGIGPESDFDFSSGVTYQELSDFGNYLVNQNPTGNDHLMGMDIYNKILDTELLDLVQGAIEHSSGKIARLLEKHVGKQGIKSSDSHNDKSPDDFDIRDFV